MCHNLSRILPQNSGHVKHAKPGGQGQEVVREQVSWVGGLKNLAPMKGGILRKSIPIGCKLIISGEVFFYIGERIGNVAQIPGILPLNCLVGKGTNRFQIPLKRGHVKEVTESGSIDPLSGPFLYFRNVVFEKGL